MPTMRTPQGITPPAPGLDREEPTFVPERDIPSSDRRPAAEGGSPRDERPSSRSPERE